MLRTNEKDFLTFDGKGYYDRERERSTRTDKKAFKKIMFKEVVAAQSQLDSNTIHDV